MFPYSGEGNVPCSLAGAALISWIADLHRLTGRHERHSMFPTAGLGAICIRAGKILESKLALVLATVRNHGKRGEQSIVMRMSVRFMTA